MTPRSLLAFVVFRQVDLNPCDGRIMMTRGSTCPYSRQRKHLPSRRHLSLSVGVSLPTRRLSSSIGVVPSATGAGETAWGRIGICGVRLNDRATGAMAMAGLAVDGLTGIGALGIGDEWGLIPGASALSSRALSRSRASSLVARSWSSLSFV